MNQKSQKPLDSKPVTTPETEGFVFNQTMFRIKEPGRSLQFYRHVLGMTLLQKLDFPGMKFSLFFLGYARTTDDPLPEDPVARAEYTFSQKGLLELTHNWGTEQEDGEIYHNGNSEPRGFGHIGLSVPDVEKACAHFEREGVKFVKRPNEGSMKGLAFIQDPDGYWIEILESKSLAGLCRNFGNL